MSADYVELGAEGPQLWKRYLHTYENPKVYRNVTNERREIRYVAESLMKIYDSGDNT